MLHSISNSQWGRKRDRKILLMSAILENSGHKSGDDFSNN